MRLTVAIPTYNRNRNLHKTLEYLLPQLNDQCELLIFDNCSDVPVEETLRDLLATFPQVHCRIMRNRVNLGPTANFMRCFEECETEWIWLLGDDDQPAPDAITTVLSHLDARPDCTFFNFASDRFRRERSVYTTGLREFVYSLDYWSLLLFMSVGIYHCPTVLPNLRVGYLFAYSLAPHVAIVLASLGDQGVCCFSHKPIIRHQAPAEWCAVNALLGKMTLLDLPMEDDVRREFARKLRAHTTLEGTTVMLMKMNLKKRDWRHAIYCYDQICSRVYYHERKWTTRLRIPAYRLMVRFSRLVFPLVGATFPFLKQITGFRHMQLDMVVPDASTRL